MVAGLDEYVFSAQLVDLLSLHFFTQPNLLQSNVGADEGEGDGANVGGFVGTAVEGWFEGTAVEGWFDGATEEGLSVDLSDGARDGRWLGPPDGTKVGLDVRKSVMKGGLVGGCVELCRVDVCIALR
jgi:hypothetical protein